MPGVYWCNCDSISEDRIDDVQGDESEHGEEYGPPGQSFFHAYPDEYYDANEQV